MNVHADMSGYYMCEVTTQRTFETVTDKQYLLVVREYHRSELGEIILHSVHYCVGVQTKTDFIC